MKVLDYYNKFECIGSDCEDSCCSGWTVTIDKKTYRKYKNISDISFRKEVLSNLRRDRRNGGDYKVKLREDTSCAFLNEDKLCNIYQRCGEDHLSNTCTIFPRLPRYFFNQHESTLSLACPEVARLAILPEEPVQLIDIEQDTVHSERIQSLPLQKLVSQIAAEAEPSYEGVRTVSLHIVQMRQISLDERLFLLGLFLNQLTDAAQQNDYILMNEIIVEFIDSFENIDGLLVPYREFESNPRMKLEYSLTVLLTEYPKTINPRLAECLDWLNQGLDINYDEFELDKILEKYQSANEQFYQPFLQERGYFLENYLVSHLFNAIEGQNSLFDTYLRLITSFTNIQTALIGMASFHQKLDTTHVLQLIQSYERFISHNNTYLPSLLKRSQDLNFNSLAAMMLLIKP